MPKTKITMTKPVTLGPTLNFVTTPGHADSMGALAEHLNGARTLLQDETEMASNWPAQPTCELHQQLRCPKRHGTKCTSTTPCINKGEPV